MNKGLPSSSKHSIKEACPILHNQLPTRSRIMNTSTTSSCQQSLIVLGCHFQNKTLNSPQLAISDTLMWVMITLVSTVMTFLMVALIVFEKCGGDPQKRSLGNRLVSSNLIGNLAQCWTINTLLVLARSVILVVTLF